MINSSPKFSSWRYVLSGEAGTMTRGCKVEAVLKLTGDKVEGTEITMQMAKAEGWLDRAGSKWKTMPEHMLRLRAASFFGGEFLADKLFGMTSAEELGDIIEGTSTVVKDGPPTGVAGAKELLKSTASS
jgi:hypothetical protein